MSKSAVAVLLASTLLAASFVSLSHDDHSTSVSLGQAAHADHGASHGTALAPPDGERWPTDPPLRTGMSNIQAAVEQFTAGEPALANAPGRLRAPSRRTSGTSSSIASSRRRPTQRSRSSAVLCKIIETRSTTRRQSRRGRIDGSQPVQPSLRWGGQSRPGITGTSASASWLCTYVKASWSEPRAVGGPRGILDHRSV